MIAVLTEDREGGQKYLTKLEPLQWRIMNHIVKGNIKILDAANQSEGKCLRILYLQMDN